MTLKSVRLCSRTNDPIADRSGGTNTWLTGCERAIPVKWVRRESEIAFDDIGVEFQCAATGFTDTLCEESSDKEIPFRLELSSY